ncbi:sodium:solute symporter family protein, partial [Gimesia maris]
MLFAAEKNTWLGLHTADWIILALYFVVILAIGLWSVKKVKDMADFFMGGRRFGKVFMMFFAFGSGTSSEQAISVVAGTWRAGLAGIWWQFLWLWATPFYWIVAPLMRRMRALTTADFFETRFNGPTAVMYSFYGIAISITFIAGGLFGTGKMVDALTGNELDRLSVEVNIMVPAAEWDTTEKTFHITERRLQGYEFAILAVTVMFVIYGMAGGLGAAIITDFIQGILTIIFSFLLLPFVFYEIGGFGMLHEQSDLKKGMLDLTVSPELAATMGEPITPFYVCMLSITALAGIVIQPHIMGVCGAGKTEYEGRFGFTVGNFLKRFCTVAWTFTGLACIVWYMGDNSPLKTSADPADQAIY